MNILVKKGPAGVKPQAQTRLTSAIGWTKNEANRKRDAGDDYYWATYSSANSTGVVASALAEAGEALGESIGSGAVLVTGSVVTAGEARTMLRRSGRRA